MENRFIHVEVRDGSVVPAAAEVLVRAEAEHMTPTTELRGRLMGPRCRFAETIEVAYPLRPFIRPPQGFAGLSGRAVIPEASLWDPQSPFLYQGPIELWQDGRICQRVMVSHGLRTLVLGPRGLFVNGRRLVLQGRSVTALTEAEALALREAGVNLLVAPVSAATQALWDLADRVGFLVLGRIADCDDETAARVAALSAHASCLGWLAAAADVGRAPDGGFVGVSVERRLEGPLPERVQFVVGDAERTDLGLPLLVRGAKVADAPGILGLVE